MTETQINDYLSYSEAVRESVIPGYKFDWKVEFVSTPEESEPPVNTETPDEPENVNSSDPEVPTETNPEDVTTEPNSDPEVNPSAE